ncbi:hypothetical protein N0P70_005430 [Klebsiella michiganensis]|nr:hypothetical protein [Klebsiella michiganensis]
MTEPLTCEQLRELAKSKVNNLKRVITQSAFTGVRDRLEEELQLAEFALAALNAEPVADVAPWSHPTEERTCDIRWRRFDVAPGPLFAVPQAPFKPHQLRELVNQLQDVAVTYHGTQQLRGRIAHVVHRAFPGPSVTR